MTAESPNKIIGHELQGRSRRHACRRNRLALNEGNDIETDYSKSLRGRPRRRHKRHLRLMPGAQTSRINLTMISGKDSGQTSSSARQNPYVVPEDDTMPSWLLGASIKHPIHFKRVSGLLHAVNDDNTIVLDRSTIDAIIVVGGDHCNDLLGLLINSRESVRLTVPGVLALMGWISLTLLKRLAELSAISIITPSLILAVVPNKYHGIDLLEYFVEVMKFSFDDDLIHNMLTQAMDSINSSDGNVEHYCCLSEKLMTYCPEAKLSAGIIRKALEAEQRSAKHFGLQTDARPPIETFLERYSEPQNAQDLLEIALDRCSTATIESILSHWPEVSITRTMMMTLFRKPHFRDGDVLLQQSKQQSQQNLLILKDTRLFVDETLVVNLLCEYGNAQVLTRLRTIEPNLPVSQLITRTAGSLFSLQELHEHFREEDFILNDISLMAAMDKSLMAAKDNESQREQSAVIVQHLFSKAPPTAVSAKVILVAAQAMPYSTFRKILDHNRSVEIDPLVFIAIMRSVYPAVKKSNFSLAETFPTKSV
ncbi:MAG: hypothetical protein LQ342_007662 [Letrouitia transgressa]|nr:MAG: hypothetical protein LQ342_007662 [Letrouitia transgressa]